MTKARDLARLSPNSSGLLPDANLAGISASKLSGAVAKANAVSGSIIQAVSATLTTMVTGSVDTWTDIISASITPTSASSKILVLYNTTSKSGGNETLTRMQRNGSNLPVYTGGDVSFVGATMGSFYSTNPWGGQSMGSQYLDSPASTSAVTYKIQGYQNYESLVFNRSNATNASDSQGGITTITLLEIAP